MDQLLVILGPTSTGKTDLALNLAKKFNGELVACDSRQIYKRLDIGTGKLPGSDRWEVKRGRRRWEVGGVRIWMYDVVDPQKQYSVANYVKDADKIISSLRKKGKLPIIVGGTGLYLKALLYGLSNLSIPVDKKLRKQLEQLSLTELQKKLQLISTKEWEKMNDSDKQNPRRLVRAIEIAIQGGRLPHPAFGRTCNDILKIGLTASREVLYYKSDERLVKRIKQGMIDEASRLYKNGLSLKRMRQLGLEYGVLADFLEKKLTKGELIKILQFKIHDYIRRQMTYFKKEKDIFWVDITEKNFSSQVEKKVYKWYYP